MQTAHEFFLDELHDIYNAEKKLLDILAAAERDTQRGDAKRAFARHRKQTEGHVTRLEAAFRSIGAPPQEKDCEGLDGLVEEKESTEAEGLSPELRDMNTLVSAVKIERYESSAYETLIFLAQQMGHREAARQLRETLREEQEAARLMLELLKASKLHWTEGMEQAEEVEAPRRRRAA
ncbi:MAG: ferritin-like domain-containing protein [Terriglobales bacterium]